ncbi:MAG TPA: phospholipase C, phosphocholine-specific [Actinokineospora sp.]|nr:phospholipase C, phosphocholine-specific [Actinokineospora sp.]
MNLSRRRFLGDTAKIAAVGAAAAVIGESTAQAATTGTIRDVKHVVVLMQENRSFDHYFGSLSGVRGFSDRSTLDNVFVQPSWAGGTQRPWRMSLTAPVFGDSGSVLAQCDGSLLHSWNDQHSAWNKGLMNNWVFAKLSDRSLGFLNRADIPFHYALADAYTVCDAYHCSTMSATGPNRTYLWSGMIDPLGTAGGPASDGGEESGLRWQTYAEALENAGVSWKVYQNANDNYGDNGLAYFKQFTDAPAGSALRTKGMASVPGVTGSTPDDIVAAIRADVVGGTLPQVSWVVANQAFSEHPDCPPNDGAWFINKVLGALNADAESFNSTVLFLNYDENDGFFDHVPPPIPPEGAAAEFLNGTPIGLGFRVPMVIVSPWTRGGWVDSQVYDHTSVIRFMETWTAAMGTPAACSNISPWRRAICGDLTGAFDFTKKTTGLPLLPTVPAPYGQKNCDSKVNPNSDTVPDTVPVQEPGTRPARAVPYQPNARFSRWETGRPNSSGLQIWLQMSQTGQKATRSASTMIVANKYRGGGPWNYEVPASAGVQIPLAVEDFFNIGSGSGDGKYDLSVFGPNRFLRRFSGNYYTASAKCEVDSDYDVTGSALKLKLTNSTTAEQTFTITSNQYAQPGAVWPYYVPANTTTTVNVPLTVSLAGHTRTSSGWYDVTVTLGADPLWSRRLVGHIETGAASVTGSDSAAVVAVGLRSQMNNRFVCAENAGASTLIANRTGIGPWETFDLIANPDGTVSLRARVNGKFVCADNEGSSALVPNRVAIGGWEKFVLAPTNSGNGTYSLRSLANNRYVTAGGDGSSSLIASSTSVGGAESFWVSVV